LNFLSDAWEFLMAGYQTAEHVLYQVTWNHIQKDHNLNRKQLCQSEDQNTGSSPWSSTNNTCPIPPTIGSAAYIKAILDTHCLLFTTASASPEMESQIRSCPPRQELTTTQPSVARHSTSWGWPSRTRGTASITTWHQTSKVTKCVWGTQQLHNILYCSILLH
jgi:hypothetical protein